MVKQRIKFLLQQYNWTRGATQLRAELSTYQNRFSGPAKMKILWIVVPKCICKPLHAGIFVRTNLRFPGSTNNSNYEQNNVVAILPNMGIVKTDQPAPTTDLNLLEIFTGGEQQLTYQNCLGDTFDVNVSSTIEFWLTNSENFDVGGAAQILNNERIPDAQCTESWSMMVEFEYDTEKTQLLY
jgi:hypothetical protein